MYVCVCIYIYVCVCVCSGGGEGTGGCYDILIMLSIVVVIGKYRCHIVRPNVVDDGNQFKDANDVLKGNIDNSSSSGDDSSSSSGGSGEFNILQMLALAKAPSHERIQKWNDIR